MLFWFVVLLIIAGLFTGAVAAGFVVFAWAAPTLHNSKKRRNKDG